MVIEENEQMTYLFYLVKLQTDEQTDDWPKHRNDHAR